MKKRMIMTKKYLLCWIIVIVFLFIHNNIHNDYICNYYNILILKMYKKLSIFFYVTKD